ncbi:hypothetical protein DFH06DRAFT_1429618 [Mycena polygramma]|nr:hypothetical protein DFH06DRAFT_1429618 [Mycena polygramma]
MPPSTSPRSIPMPPTPYPRPKSTKSTSALVKYAPKPLPIRRSQIQEPEEPFRFFTFPPDASPRVQFQNAVPTGLIESSTGNEVVALPTRAHPTLPAEPRPDTPGFPRRLHEKRPDGLVRKPSSGVFEMEDILPSPAPISPEEDRAVVSSVFRSRFNVSNARAEKFNVEAFKRSLDEKFGRIRNPPCVFDLLFKKPDAEISKNRSIAHPVAQNVAQNVVQDVAQPENQNGDVEALSDTEGFSSVYSSSDDMSVTTADSGDALQDDQTRNEDGGSCRQEEARVHGPAFAGSRDSGRFRPSTAASEPRLSGPDVPEITRGHYSAGESPRSTSDSVAPSRCQVQNVFCVRSVGSDFIRTFPTWFDIPLSSDFVPEIQRTP